MKVYRAFALILALIFCASPLAGCADDAGEVTLGGTSSDETTEATAPEIDPATKFAADGEPIYTIVRPLDPTTLESGMGKKLKDVFLETLGVKFEIATDYDGQADNSQRFEILIGNTNRPESQKAAQELAASGGFIVREEGNKILILGEGDNGLAKAFSEFQRIYLGENNATLVGVYSPETAIPAGYDKVSDATEALLTVKDGFDYTEAYKVNFVGATDTPASTLEIKTGLIESEYDTLYNVVAELNVLSFGAKGDGKSDDTEAFRAALRAADERNGCVIYVPKGYYCLTESLTVGDNVSIVGEIKPGTAEGTVLCIYGDRKSVV